MTDNKITIEVDAIDNASGVMKKLGGNTQEAAKKATISFTDFRSAYMIAMDAVRVGQQVWQATGAEFIKYADSVRDVSRSLGSTSEEASRLIQVADDVFISYDKLTIAMKMAQKQGIDPSIEGLAKLSDKYLALAPGVERTQFLLKNFGKSGLEMGKLMEKGGDGIRKMSAAIEKNLVLSKAQTDLALKNKQAQDALGDAVKGLQIAIGSDLTPTVTDAITELTTLVKWVGDNYEAIKKFGDGVAWVVNPLGKLGLLIGKTLHPAQKDLTVATEEATVALTEEERAAISTTAAADALAEKTKSLTKSNQDYISGIMSYASAESSYRENQKSQLEEIARAQDELTLAVDKYGQNSAEALDATANLDNAKQGLADLSAEWKKTTSQMIFDMMQARLMADGVLTEAETSALLGFAKQSGLFTAEQAKGYNDLTNMMTAYLGTVGLGEEAQRRVTQEINNSTAAAGGLVTTMAGLQYSAPIGPTFSGGNLPSSSTMTGRPKNSAVAKRDSGGSGMAGVPYMIGRGAQPELFTPATNGTFTPNADKIGSTYNIVINNPTGKTAENDIRNALKSLSYIGVAQ